ncbi:MAG: radical SAM protein [Bdellovibrionota bacterium]
MLNQTQSGNRLRFVTSTDRSGLKKFSGPLSGAMWSKVSQLGSAYPDNFDYTIYDRLHDRYGAETPRGGLVFRSPLKLVNYHATCTKCHYAFEIDTYGRGCMHDCAYCYAKDTLTKYGYWNRPHPFPVDLAEVRKLFYTIFETNRKHRWRSIFEKRIPLRIGSMSDSFMWMDKRYGVSLELLKILNFYKYPYVVFTRSDLIAEKEYITAIDPALGAVQFSISGSDERLTKLLEPGAPSVARRLKALKTLAEVGIWTTVRINPLFPTYPDGYFTDHNTVENRFNGNIPRFPFLDIDHCGDFFDQLAAAHVPSVLVGFVRLTSYSVNQVTEATGTDFKEFFRPEVTKTGKGGNRDKNYSDSEIAFYYKKFQSECARRNMRFSTCYIGNGIKDYYQYQELWSNKSDCCDVVGNVSEFRETSQSIPWSDRIRHAPQAFQTKRGYEFEQAYSGLNGELFDKGKIVSTYYENKDQIFARSLSEEEKPTENLDG